MAAAARAAVAVAAVAVAVAAADCFVIATGTSDPHLKALRNNLESTLKKNDIEILSRDRFQPSGWLVLDAIDFVVHLFSKEQRENYALEHLWKDADYLNHEDL